MTEPTITIVTPWRDHLELAPDYWDTVGPLEADVLIVDDGSVPPLQFGNVRFDECRGFSRACNAGLESADTEAVLFLNNDVAGGHPGWLDRILSQLEPGALVGARLRHDPHADVDGQSLPYLDGWCLAGMRDDLLELGGFDETLAEPAYYSDNLLCLEARAAGFVLREVLTGLRHKCGATTLPHRNPDVQRATNLNRARYVERARQLLEQEVAVAD